jgi:arsenate reductase-like glutaredoxin family protein
MAFPDLLGDGSVETLYARLQKDHEAHVLQSAALANAAKLAGTPVLVAGKKLLVGYGANPWMQALEAKAYCE